MIVDQTVLFLQITQAAIAPNNESRTSDTTVISAEYPKDFQNRKLGSLITS